MTIESKPIFKGFKIELPSSNISLNVQDIYGNIIHGAEVTLERDGTLNTWLSDTNGCIVFSLKGNLIYNINIRKQYYKEHQGKIIMLPATDFPNSNFIIKLVDSDNLPVEGANVTINHGSDIIEGVSNTEGIFETNINTGLNYMLLASKDGYQTFSSKMNSFVRYSCRETNNILVPVITL